MMKSNKIVLLSLCLIGLSRAEPKDSTHWEGKASGKHLRYGTVYHPAPMMFNSMGPGGTWGGGGGSVTKHFAICYQVEGEEACRESQWIGFTGENLEAAVSEVPEAKAKAAQIQTTTLVQTGSLIAVPICLFSAISLANGSKDEYGNAQTHVGPGALTLFVLTGAAFVNYIGWNIYEGIVARDAIEIYNNKVGLNTRLERSGAGVDLSYRF